MKKITLVTIGILLILGSCGVPQDEYEKLKSELNETKEKLSNCSDELKVCSNELTEIKNTAENRFIRAKKLLANSNLNDAKLEFQGIVDNFKGTKDAEIASMERDNTE